MNRIDGRMVLSALSGLGIWALCFVVLYAGLSLGCQAGIGQSQWGGLNTLSLLLSLAWLAHAIWLGALVWRAWMRQRDAGQAEVGGFMRTLTVGLHAAAWLALLPLAAPILVLAPCV